MRSVQVGSPLNANDGRIGRLADVRVDASLLPSLLDTAQPETRTQIWRDGRAAMRGFLRLLVGCWQCGPGLCWQPWQARRYLAFLEMRLLNQVNGRYCGGVGTGHDRH